ncbi:MAG: 2'-5' RNA ligase family protein, partial [Myxococcales bacterium]
LAQEAAACTALALAFRRPVRMARGALIAVQAPTLVALHARLARSFEPWLTAQDRQRLSPHVTVMNKATPEAARAALAELEAGFVPWSGQGEALQLWAYRGGPWEALRRFPFAVPGAPERA